MPGLVVVGAQWGDEGKGKLVDCLTASAAAVVRYQGGNNAGHTLVVGDKVTKLHLVPSGILRPQARCYLGAGMVINPFVLLKEAEELKRSGINVSPERLFLDREAHLIMPYHEHIDRSREIKKGKQKIGTTGRGIGPAYEDKAARIGVRAAELAYPAKLKARLEILCEEKNAYLRDMLGVSELLEAKSEWDKIAPVVDKLAPFLGNVSLRVSEELALGRSVIFEGAQGVLLDTTFGTVPYVTSSSTIAGGVCTGVGIGPKHINYVLGVAKAYCTRVGEGPFPSEMDGEFGAVIRERGGEYGTTTGRPRRCGWFDAVAMRRAVRLSGLEGIAITKLDVLSGCETIRIAAGYIRNGKHLDDMPVLVDEFSDLSVDWVTLPGWKASLTTCRSWSELPREARDFILRIEELSRCPVTLVSVGPERTQILATPKIATERQYLGV